MTMKHKFDITVVNSKLVCNTKFIFLVVVILFHDDIDYNVDNDNAVINHDDTTNDSTIND